jgi:hypothetical protein
VSFQRGSALEVLINMVLIPFSVLNLKAVLLYLQFAREFRFQIFSVHCLTKIRTGLDYEFVIVFQVVDYLMLLIALLQAVQFCVPL